MLPVTVWIRLNTMLVREFVRFSHLEDGHSELPAPVPKHPNHVTGWRGEWKKIHALLSDDVPPKLLYISGRPFEFVFAERMWTLLELARYEERNRA